MSYTFDGPNKLIILSTGTNVVSVRDIWSRWADWFQTSDNSKYLPAFEQVGGQAIDLSAGTSIPIFAFLKNGWKVRPQEANHTLVINDGVLLVDGGGDPFVNTIGSYTVRINYQQPVQAITVATGGGGSLTAAQVWDHILENGITALEMQRIIFAALAGKMMISGNSVIFRDMADTLNRIAATVDANGRSSVTVNGG